MTRYAALFLILLFAAAVTANADIAFDRGLPTDNLNNAAGANRSNVAWGDYSPYPLDPKNPTSPILNWAVGDDFSLGMAGSYDVTDLRVWIVATGNQPVVSG